MDINIDTSRKLLDKLLLMSLISFLLIPLLIFSYFKLGESKFVETKKYYLVVAEEGKERVGKLQTISRPLINVNGVRKWLRVAMTDIYITNVNNYSSQERWNKISEYFTSTAAVDFWEQEITRQEALIGESYIVTNAVMKSEPILMGEMKNKDGEKYWKFYLEVATENKSSLKSRVLQQELRIIAVVKQMNPKIKDNGIAITSIKIK